MRLGTEAFTTPVKLSEMATPHTSVITHSEVDVTSLKRRVAGGCVSAHSCQYCKEFTVSVDFPRQGHAENMYFYDPEDYDLLTEEACKETSLTVKLEALHQNAEAGCQLWSIVRDEVDYVSLLIKRERGAYRACTLGNLLSSLMLKTSA